MPVRAIYVPLTADEMEALKLLGRQEDRDPRRQAARLLRESLARAGALTGARSATLTASSPDPRSVA